MTSFFKKICLVLCLLPALVFAGGMSNQGDATQLTNDPKDIAAFSKQVEKYLAEKGAKVALVSRVGRPQSQMPEGVKYTHVGFWVYSNIKLTDGRTVPGYVTYNLYQRNNELDKSDLVSDFPAEFFSNVYSLEAGVIIPKPSLQDKLLKVIGTDTYKKMHVSNYSVTANPFNDMYQNCTEFILDVLLSTLYNTDNYAQIKANAKAYFTPKEIKLSPVKKLFGPMFVKDFTTRDQPGSKILTTTYETLVDFLKQYNLVTEVNTIKYKQASY